MALPMPYAPFAAHPRISLCWWLRMHIQGTERTGENQGLAFGIGRGRGRIHWSFGVLVFVSACAGSGVYKRRIGFD